MHKVASRVKLLADPVFMNNHKQIKACIFNNPKCLRRPRRLDVKYAGWSICEICPVNASSRTRHGRSVCLRSARARLTVGVWPHRFRDYACRSFHHQCRLVFKGRARSGERPLAFCAIITDTRPHPALRGHRQHLAIAQTSRSGHVSTQHTNSHSASLARPWQEEE
jgi:hypothetical protein